MSGTRGPRTGRIPPHIQERVDRKRARAAARTARRPSYPRRLLAAVLSLLLFVAGFVLGRATAPDPGQQDSQPMDSLESVEQEMFGG